MDNVPALNPTLDDVESLGGSLPNSVPNAFSWSRLRASKALLSSVVELALLATWTVLFTYPYLNFDPSVVPAGREYLSGIQTHHLWTQMSEHGLAALWNGSERGGAPAFADLHGSMLYPLVALATVLLGVVNGSKLVLVAAFFIGGVAQWWIARLLLVGRVARVWSACMAVVAGYLAARMELGLFGVVLSTASCALVLPAIILASRARTSRSSVVLGVTLALAILAGQGYMQIGLVLCLPAAVLLLPVHTPGFSRAARTYVLGACVALLLAGPLLAPVIHFLPEFAKDVDPEFKSAQPFSYVPLNLVIDDAGFYQTGALHKFPYAHLYSNFLGWIPVLLALFGLGASGSNSRKRSVLFLSAFAVMAMWVSSGQPLMWLAKNIPIQWAADQFAGVRHPPQIAGLAAPAILGLAALGVDRILRLPWPRLQLAPATSESGRFWNLDARWLLAIPLVLALTTAYGFNRQWIFTERLSPDIDAVLSALRTPDMEWVNPPFGEHFWIERGVAMGLKMNMGIRTWNWKGRQVPEAVLEANRAGPPPGMGLKSTVAGVPIYAAPPGREYAAISHSSGGRTVCTGQGAGGEINVECDSPQPGVLTVKENSLSGWSAFVDGQAVPLRSGQWLALDLQAGIHRIEFRYVPWDVPLGLFLCVVGLALSAFLLLKKETAPPMNELGA